MQTPAPGPRVTLRDVAGTLGVSHVTVSLALRNSPKITERRRLEIQAAAARMGYQPNAMAAALAHLRKSSNVIPVRAALAWLNLWPQPKRLRGYVEFDRYWQGAHRAAEKFGYHLEEFVCGDERQPTSPSRLGQILHARGINGILLPPHPVTPAWNDFPWERFSAVRFGRSVEQPRVHLVASDQVTNAMLAFETMRKRGYDRVGFITGSASRRGVRLEAGYLLAQRFVEPSQRLPILALDDEKMRKHGGMLTDWVKAERPDAVFTDMQGVPALFKRVGLRVPEDIGLAVASVLDGNADSGIDQNPEEIGRVALLVLVSLINDYDRGVPPIFRQILVEGTWVDGSSLPARR